MTLERRMVPQSGNILVWTDTIFHRQENGSFALSLQPKQLKDIIMRNPQIVPLLQWETDSTRRQDLFQRFTEEECISEIIPSEIKEILSMGRPEIIAQGISTYAELLSKAHRRKGEMVLAEILELPKWAALYSGIGYMIFGHRITLDEERQELTPELFKDMVHLGKRIYPKQVIFSSDDQVAYAYTKTIIENYCKDPQDIVGFANGMKDFYKQASDYWDEQKRLCSVLLYTALRDHVPPGTPMNLGVRVKRAVTHVLGRSS